MNYKELLQILSDPHTMYIGVVTMKRRMLEKTLRGHMDTGSLFKVRQADAFVDAALDQVFSGEEPSLCTFLESDPSVQNSFESNLHAIQFILLSDSENGIHFHESMKKVDKLIHRLVGATAMKAVLKERENSSWKLNI